MIVLYLIIIVLTVGSLNSTAQTYKQKGVVRLMTTSAASPITPVAGVKVAIGNNISKPTDSNGAFTMQVTKQFQVNGVTPGDEYVLALPTKGKTYTQSPNDVDVIVTTKAKRDADYKRLYSDLKQKYRQQTDEIKRLKDELSDRMDELQESDAEFARVKAQRDSLQNLYREYVENTEKIDEEIKKIAEDLAITDFQSLNETEQQVYELKCKGEFETINKLLQRVVWHGDRSAALKRQDNLIAQKEQELKEEKQNRETMLRLLLDDIEAFKVQHMNDSVSECYKILTDAEPNNWEYLNSAGRFEQEYMANFVKAMDYYQWSIETNPSDTLLATSYNNIGGVFDEQGDYSKALEYHEKALNLRLASLGVCHPDVAISYNDIGGVY